MKPLVAGLFKDLLEPDLSDKRATMKPKRITVSSEFQDQLKSLMDTVRTTDPHFIRCIKPNPHNLPDIYDRPSVTEQLRYGGVLQAVQVSRAGYPVRINHKDGWLDYRHICPKEEKAPIGKVPDPKMRAQRLLEALDKPLKLTPGTQITWAVGKTLVFFKQDAYEKLQNGRLKLRNQSATKVRARFLGVRSRAKYALQRWAVKKMQALARGKAARRVAQKLRSQKAASVLTSRLRGCLVRKRYHADRRRVIRIQAFFRGILGRRRAKNWKLHCNATEIQARWRAFSFRKKWLALRRGALFSQIRLRQRAAKMQLRTLKQGQKEVGALLNKYQKAQEELKQYRRQVEDLDIKSSAIEHERAALDKNVNSLAEKVEEAKNSLQSLKAQHEADLEELRQTHQQHLDALGEAAAAEEQREIAAVKADVETRQAAEKKALEEKKTQKQKSKPLKEVTNNETTRLVVEELRRELSEKTKEQDELKTVLAELDAKLKASKENETKLADLSEQLLKNMTQVSAVKMGGTAGTAGPARAGAGPEGGSRRNVDIVLTGVSKVGKSALLRQLLVDYDNEALQKFDEPSNKVALMAHHSIKIDGAGIKVLDCSGNERARHLVKEWFQRAIYVFVVYDLCSPESLDAALALLPEVQQAGASCVLFGSKWQVEQGGKVSVDILRAKDVCARSEPPVLTIESSAIADAVKTILPDLVMAADRGATSKPVKDEGGMFKRMSTMATSLLGMETAKEGKVSKVLRLSLKGTKAMRSSRRDAEGMADLKPVQELQDSDSAVTCICFGQENANRGYILLAAASKDGQVVVYRCYRTEMELKMLPEQAPGDEKVQKPSEHSNIAIHSRLVGHTRAITSIFFNLLEDNLVTTSIDKSVRFWSVDSGEMLKVFTDSSPVPVASFLPFNPSVFVAANSNAVLRLVNVQNGQVLQKLKVETEVRALKFDDTGLFLIAGTKNGFLHVLEAIDACAIKFKFKLALARGGVTCITFVQAAHGFPPCLLVNTADSSVAMVDCTYGPPAGVLTNLAVRHRVRVAHSLLPLKCCYSPSGQGYLISGSEDKEVYIYALAKGTNYKMQYLKHHQVPVVAVATNKQDTLLASADSLGRIVLWRRMDFSALGGDE